MNICIKKVDVLRICPTNRLEQVNNNKKLTNKFKNNFKTTQNSQNIKTFQNKLKRNKK